MSERTPSRDPFDLCESTIGDKYRINSVVGTGGFGVVYRGVHTGFGEPIAVKCLKLPSELDPEAQEKLLTRLQDEGRVLHRLSRLSSGIVQALDVGAVTTPNGQWVPYLVLEWLEGQTLAEHVKERAAAGEDRLPLEAAIELLEPAARALAVAHQQKVAHRDVKPENLVLTEVSGQRTLKVLDFGIAKVLAHHSEFTAAPAATQKVATAFTPNYGAPEQFNKKRGATGPWTDVFALALILVELVSGERALDGDDATQLYIAAADPAGRPTLRYRGVDTSDAVEQVLQRALAVDPHDRYPDAGTFWDDLRAAAGQQLAPLSTELDNSETGEFVSRHGIGLAPDELSEVDRALEVRARDAAKAPGPDGQATGDTTAEEGGGTDDEPATLEADPDERHPTESVAGAVSADGSATTAERRDEDPPRAGSNQATRALTPAAKGDTQPSQPTAASDGEEPKGSPRHRDAPRRPPETADTGAPTSASERRSSWWMAVVAVAALAGAGLLYAKLQQEQNDPVDGGRRRSSGAPRTLPTSGGGTSSIHAAAGAGGGAGNGTAGGAGAPAGGADAGGGGGATGGGGAAPDGGPPPPPPAGMVHVPLPDSAPVAGVERGFFLDRMEVSTGAYRECITAGRCVRAGRVVLPEQVARELWGSDSTTPGEPGQAPEQLAEAWGRRCNDARGELDHPINCVNHASAVDYCRWKDRRLPTAAEWRLAASGTTGRRFPWGTGAPQCGDACFGLNGSCVTSAPQVATCAVGAHPRDRTVEGIVDLGANVSEWVGDAVETPAHLQPRRMLFGGSFTDEADALAGTPVKTLPAVTAFVTIGFRCALDLSAAEPAEPTEPADP